MARSTPPTQTNASEPDEIIVAPLCSIFRRFLKKRGLKFTSERALILDAVLSKDGLFEAEQLMYEMYDAGQKVSKATIYRTIKHLVEAGIIQEVRLDSKQAHYQLIYGRKPTDYLVNVDTDEIVEFHSPELIQLCESVCREHGLEPDGHQLIIYARKPSK
ncbi:transcriptional repressor [Planctomycetales bacterium ZRK34]|nr:transcriptional repressor [Planctomycetales bacterium ZRK34]